MVELLLASKADVNAKDNDGWTPLHTATGKDVVELLLAHGADVNAKTSGGRTPLHIAAMIGEADKVELLLANGAEVNAKDNGGCTPMYEATLMGPIMALNALGRPGWSNQIMRTEMWWKCCASTAASYSKVSALKSKCAW